MPLIIDGGNVPARWDARDKRSSKQVKKYAAGDDCITIAFINNMPDAALEDTEMQFFHLLDAAAGDTPICVKLYSLPGVPRGEHGQQHLNNFYSTTDELFDRRFDAMIMTGTEPKQSNLRNEPYWSALANVLEWAENNTASTILSCLAAHAGVLYSDGINRRPLSDKQFGVFAFRTSGKHPLIAGTAEVIHFPHSRWNEVPASELIASGYSVLTQSAEGGVDTFVKKKKRSLFVHFQGHPEYDAHTLLKEYRRDIKRFSRRERETYPTMPKGYFDAAGESVANNFRLAVIADRREEIMAGFPEAAVVGTLEKTWDAPAVGIYRNWLQYIATAKEDVAKLSPGVAIHDCEDEGKRSLVP